MDVYKDVDAEMSDLVRAFEEARLAALHIDMQPHFYEEGSPSDREAPTAETFPVVNKFAKDLRLHSVPNYWVAYTGHWRKSTYDIFHQNKSQKDRMFLTSSLLLHSSMEVKPDELVFEKAAQSAFQWDVNQDRGMLMEHLNAAAQDTLIIDGIKDVYCVKATVSRAANLGFRVYVPLDATNCPAEWRDTFIHQFHTSSKRHQEMVTFTSTSKILSVLDQAQMLQGAILKTALG